MTRYLSAEILDQDDFGDWFTKEEGEFVYDAKTLHGPWATMTQKSYEMLGLGRGQKYQRNAEGHLVKVEG